jgi:hypothetical protein
MYFFLPVPFSTRPAPLQLRSLALDSMTSCEPKLCSQIVLSELMLCSRVVRRCGILEVVAILAEWWWMRLNSSLN